MEAYQSEPIEIDASYVHDDEAFAADGSEPHFDSVEDIPGGAPAVPVA